MDKINIEFRSYPISRNVTQVMGFQEGKKTYDVVFFLVKKWKYTYVHGLLSKVSMLSFYSDLWNWLSKNVKTSHVAFEVLECHAPAYRMGLPIEKEYELTTFDGFKSILICVNKNARLKM